MFFKRNKDSNTVWRRYCVSISVMLVILISLSVNTHSEEIRQEIINKHTWSDYKANNYNTSNHAFADTDNPISFIYTVWHTDILDRTSPFETATSGVMRIETSQTNEPLNIRLMWQGQEESFKIWPIIQTHDAVVNQEQVITPYPGNSLPLSSQYPHKDVAVTVAILNPINEKENVRTTYYYDESRVLVPLGIYYPNWVTNDDIVQHLRGEHSQKPTFQENCPTCNEIKQSREKYDRFSKNVWKHARSMKKKGKSSLFIRVTVWPWSQHIECNKYGACWQ